MYFHLLHFINPCCSLCRQGLLCVCKGTNTVGFIAHKNNSVCNLQSSTYTTWKFAKEFCSKVTDIFIYSYLFNILMSMPIWKWCISCNHCMISVCTCCHRDLFILCNLWAIFVVKRDFRSCVILTLTRSVAYFVILKQVKVLSGSMIN